MPDRIVALFRGWQRAIGALSCCLLICPAFAQTAAGDSAERGSELTVALITFGPGEEVWERFGHNAIEIRDAATGAARVYNYGMFDFAQKNFFLDFARGRMMYRIAVGDPAEEYPVYVEEGRWIVRQELNLVPAQRAKLAEYLEWNARPENAQYRYDYFRANCSTRVRDALDEALGGAIKAQLISPSRGFTYRMDAVRLMRPVTALMLGIDAGLGPYSDQRLSYWDESFVPTELMRHAREISVRDANGRTVALVANETLLNTGHLPDPQEFPPRWTWGALVSGILAALILPGLARARANAAARIVFATGASAIALVCGIGGLVLVGLWAFTEHVSAWRNENILLLNPLCLLLLPAWLGAFRRRWRPSRFARRMAASVAFCAILAWFVKILPGFVQDNYFWIALLLPMHFGSALATTFASARERL
ncbi:MAG: DUF4105 domain-containing protein [Rudaea sp.]|uniref:Lnb N-terminal periplasmic domain-containing protein n=1 Tax=Rudaea sp. TaxID=2136325 RepID=UPI0039E5AC18